MKTLKKINLQSLHNLQYNQQRIIENNKYYPIRIACRQEQLLYSAIILAKIQFQ